MQNRETLSAYMDGHNVQESFTETLCQSTELQQKWVSYHTIRSVMRGEEQLLGDDFTAKLDALLENEVIEAEHKTEKRGLLLKLKGWRTSIMQAGIAASVCLMAVLSVNLMQNDDETAQAEQPVLQTLPFSHSVQQVSYNAPAKEQPTEEQLEYQQNRINVLLQNHELQRRVTEPNEPVLDEADKEQNKQQEMVLPTQP